MFILIHKMLPDKDGKVEYCGNHKTYETREEAEEAAMMPIRKNLTFRSKVVEIANPWIGETPHSAAKGE